MRPIFHLRLHIPCNEAYISNNIDSLYVPMRPIFHLRLHIHVYKNNIDSLYVPMRPIFHFRLPKSCI